MRFILFFLIPICAVFGFDESFSKKTALDVIEQIYKKSMQEGPSNEFVYQRDLLTMYFNLPSIRSEIVDVVEDVVSINEKYFVDIQKVCERDPKNPVCKQVKRSLEEFLSTYDRAKITQCLTLMIFAVGDLSFTDNQKDLQNILLEFAVKYLIAQKYYEEVELKAVCRALEEAKFEKMRSISKMSSNSYLAKTFHREIQGIDCIQDYWEKYTFHMPLNQNSSEKSSKAEQRLRKIYVNLLKDFETIKEDYSGYIVFE